MAAILHQPARNELYRRFSSMIFLGGVCSAVVIEAQRVATHKIPKKRKNAKKNAKYFPEYPGFSAKPRPF
jgi:uncharacterized protein YijF (DUF1287 family)